MKQEMRKEIKDLPEAIETTEDIDRLIAMMARLNTVERAVLNKAELDKLVPLAMKARDILAYMDRDLSMGVLALAARFDVDNYAEILEKYEFTHLTEKDLRK